MRRLCKKTYSIDGKTYNTKKLYDYHLELKELLKDGLIESFSLPQANDIVKSKYHAIKATINDISFDSLDESRYFLYVLREVKTGRIQSYELQKPYEIVPAHKKNGKSIRKMEYLADFCLHMADGSDHVIDVKGIETDVFKLKKKLVEYLYPDVTIECVRWVAATKTWMTTKQYKEYRKLKKIKRSAA